jgi:electron transfer flavoprotein beta subunit
MKAKSKPIDIIELDSLGIDTKSRLELIKVSSPPERGGVVKMLSSPEDLIKNLKDKEGIL